LGTLYEPNSSSGQAQAAQDEITDDHSPDLIWSGHQGRVLLAQVSSPSGGGETSLAVKVTAVRAGAHRQFRG
jgi:hypothetical protein